MIIYRFLICLIASICTVPLFSQYEKTIEIETQASFFTTDYLGNLYYTDHDSLVKLVPPYHHFYSFRFRQNQMPDYIDVSNPSQLICLFRNDQHVILLDSTLKYLMRPFYLDEIGMYDIYAIVSSMDEGLWFYNINNNSLVKFNKNFIPVVRSVNLDPYFNSPHLPSFFTEYHNDLYIDVPSTGILVIDKNGNYKTAFNLPGVPDFQVLDSMIYFYRDNMINGINMADLKTVTTTLPPSQHVINAHVHPGYLILQTPGKIIVYRKNMPDE